MEIKALIPAYNEEGRIADVIAKAGEYADKVIVLNDCSSDNTGEVARKAGAEVKTNSKNLGYLKNLLKGIEAVDADILVTIDADGEHPPQRIPDLLGPILQGEADLVLGKRKKIPRFSEKLIARVTQLKTGIQDPGTGFRAFKKAFTPGISKIKGYCTCGVLVLFFYRNRARIKEVPIEEIKIDKPRGTAWRHFPQFFLVLWQILTK